MRKTIQQSRFQERNNVCMYVCVYVYTGIPTSQGGGHS